MSYILIIGGVGYIGFNILSKYKDSDEMIIILSRRSSVEKRLRLYKFISDMRNVKIIVYDNLGSVIKVIKKYGCPRLAYNLTGSIFGDRREIYDSHAYTPYRYFKYIIKSCCDSFLIHISSFYPSQAIYSNKIPEEYPHLSDVNPLSYFEESKMAGEYLLRSLYKTYGGRFIILRPGIVIGAYPYHIEWLILDIISRYKIGIYDNRLFPLTPAIDIVNAVEYLFHKYYEVVNFFKWYNLTPYNIKIKDLFSLYGDKSLIRFNLENMRSLYTLIPYDKIFGYIRMMLQYRGGYYISKRLHREGFNKWTPIKAEIIKMKGWIKEVPLFEFI